MSISAHDRKRVKVYELRNNDWFDRGTGFCTGQLFDDEPKILVESEDEPSRLLLESRISREDGYQKQQETLIVWTEPNGTDMALSFQEAEGCGVVWDFVCHVQQHLSSAGQDDAVSEDALEGTPHPVMLPSPDLSNLHDIEQIIVATSASQQGRDAVARFVIQEQYLLKLIPFVAIAEDLEDLPDLHRLCNIMKAIILLNDNTIIEQVVSDPVIIPVVGALEYDPEFPSHKANHRHYLNDRSRYKEVVPIKDPIILRKIRHTWRLQYLKDVVLARILDDPTFSVLNSLIFFNQVDIVQHLQSNSAFLGELFSLFRPTNANNSKKEEAVQFIHQCMGIAKNLQVAARGGLFANLINHGLFSVIAFSVKHPNPAIRTTGIDILVVLLDHDPPTMRGYILKAVTDKKVPLIDALIDLLHSETDLGVKAQLADALKILLDPQPMVWEATNRPGEAGNKMRPQQYLSDSFIQNYFDEFTQRLFAPLVELEYTEGLKPLSFQDVALFSNLVDILTFFVRQHPVRSRNLIHEELLIPRIAQLLSASQKHLKLTALKFFRTLVGIQDTFYLAQMTHNNTFELIVDIIYETMPRDNLVNSACLELFEYIKRENIKPVISHIVEKYREKFKDIIYVDTFQLLIRRYDQMQGYNSEVDATLFSQEESTTPIRTVISGGQRWQGMKEMDAVEEEYFNTLDNEDEEIIPTTGGPTLITAAISPTSTLSSSPSLKPLVDYPDDDDDETPNNQQEQQAHLEEQNTLALSQQLPLSPTVPTAKSQPLERLSFSEKRRREEDEDDDELMKLSSGPKRRNSVSSTGSSSSNMSSGSVKQRKKRTFAFGQSSHGTNTSNSPKQDKDQPQQTSPPPNGGGSNGNKISFNLNVSTATQIALKSQDQSEPTSQEDHHSSDASGSVRNDGDDEDDDDGGDGDLLPIGADGVGYESSGVAVTPASAITAGSSSSSSS